MVRFARPRRTRIAVTVHLACMVGTTFGAQGQTPSAFDLLLQDAPATGEAQGTAPAAETDAGAPAAGEPEPAEQDADDGAAEDEATDGTAADLGQTEVTGRRRLQTAPSSSRRIELGELRAVPRAQASQALMLAPGVLVTNAGGEGHAVSTFLRGFEGGTGQNLETLVDGVPVNEVSHPHSHGYADTQWVLPEVLDAVVVRNGPFEPDQGDFAFAGTAEYEFGVAPGLRGTHVGFRGGSFAQRRTHILVAPQGHERGTFAIAEIGRSDGWGANRSHERATVMGRWDRGLEDHASRGLGWGLTVMGATTRFDQPGVVRADAVDRGEQGFYDTLDPLQGGDTSRVMVALRQRVGAPGERLESTTWLMQRGYRLRENFTGETVEGRYGGLTLGSRGRWTRGFVLGGLQHRLHSGWSVRWDDVTSEQVGLRPRTAVPVNRIYRADVQQMTLGTWLGGNFALPHKVELQPSVRMDAFSFGALDRNQPAQDREGSRLDEQTARAFGYAWNPRLAAGWGFTPSSRLSVAWGQATRSTDAVALTDGETAPFARPRQVEAGVRTQRALENWTVDSATSWVWARVNRDIVFIPELTRNDVIGPSSRHALLTTVRAVGDGWFDINASAAWTRALLDDTGERVPYVPQWLGRVDAMVRPPITWRPDDLALRPWLAAGFTGTPGRPLPLGEQGTPFAVLDTAIGWFGHFLDVSLEVRNLLDLRYAQEEYFYASALGQPGNAPSRFAERYFVAGEPRTFVLSATVHLDPLLSP
jgi:hypothetical protein